MLDDRQLSRMFVRKGLIDEDTLEQAMELCKSSQRSLYDVLLLEGLVDEEKAIVQVSRQINLPCVSLNEFSANPKVLGLVPRVLAEEFQLMPLGLTEEEGVRYLFLAMANPLDAQAIEEVEKISGFPVKPLLAGPLDVRTALEKAYELGAARMLKAAKKDNSKSTKKNDEQADDGLGDMLDGLFDKEDFMSSIEEGEKLEGEKQEEKAPSLAPPKSKPADDLGFSLDFGDLDLSAGKGSAEVEDVHRKTTLPAGTTLPKEAIGGFSRTPTKVHKEPVLDEEDSLGLGSDWSDLGSFGLEEEKPERDAPAPPATRTDNSTVRYIADPSLQHSGAHFLADLSSADIVRALAQVLVNQGIVTETQIREAARQLRRR